MYVYVYAMSACDPKNCMLITILTNAITERSASLIASTQRGF